jgi:hypothetical protein
MDVRSLIKIAGLMTISLSSAIFPAQSFADVNAETNSEDRFWIDRTHKNLNKVKNYQATTELVLSNDALLTSSAEKKIAPIVSDVIFKSPDNFYQVVTQPESLEGYEASYSNNTITLHDSLNHHALQIKGLKAFEKKNAKARIQGIYMYNKEHYPQEFTPSILVAERLSVGIDFKAKEDTSKLKKIVGFVDYHYSLFMQANFIFSDATEAKVKNSHIEFNKENLTLPSIDLSKVKSIAGGQVTSWNMREKSLSKKQLKKQVSKNVAWPEDTKNTWDFSEHKYYQKGNSENAAAYYYSDDFFLITTTKISDDITPNNLNKPVLGIPLTLEKTGAILNQFPAFSTLEFSHSGISYTLLSNIHPESLLLMAKAMTGQK